MDDASKKIMENLNYVMERNGSCFTLFYNNRYTNVKVVRSHEGYNHFAMWYIKVDNKIKKSFTIKERELALYEGYAVYIEMVTERLLEIKEKKNK